jgi:phosphodiesterase/alkaline phosphatase D-like protein
MTRIVFASCMSADHDTKQDVWKEAIAHSPEWLILGGDNIYMDYFPHLNQSKRWPLDKFKDEMFARYARQFAVSSFRALVNSITPGQVLGVWDDHDFAWNNCYGADPADGMPDKKKIATSLYHHYFRALNQRPLPAVLPPILIPDLLNPPDGTLDVYRTVKIGDVQALLVDGRTYRERNPHGSAPVSLLGAAQEAWLLGELAKGPGPFLLVTGSTMTAGDDQSWDYYQDFFRNRFLPAVQGKKVIFVGGDVHENRLPPQVTGWPIEVVSSAAVLGAPYNRRDFGVLDISATEAQVFLYKRGKIQHSGKLNLVNGKFKTSVATLLRERVPKVTTRQAQAQRASAMRKLSATR